MLGVSIVMKEEAPAPAPTPGLNSDTLTVPSRARLPVRRQLSLPVSTLSPTNLANANKISPLPPEKETCDEETSLIDEKK